MDIFSAKFAFLMIIALIVLGPEKLPGALRTAGRALSELRRLSAGAQEHSRALVAQAGLSEPLDDLRSAAETFRRPLVPDGMRPRPGEPASAAAAETRPPGQPKAPALPAAG